MRLRDGLSLRALHPLASVPKRDLLHPSPVHALHRTAPYERATLWPCCATLCHAMFPVSRPCPKYVGYFAPCTAALYRNAMRCDAMRCLPYLTLTYLTLPSYLRYLPTLPYHMHVRCRWPLQSDLHSVRLENLKVRYLYDDHPYP